ncbi:MAG: amino acid ABC transporter substrate-binding protein [Woeseiaceae bacterium]|nr:amino acid ABC transporter substrate-binding protein [Woeseiaceae bacterium]
MRTLLIATATMLAFAVSANAQGNSPTLKRIAETGEFRIGYVPSAAPLSFTGPNGEPTGYSIELCRHIAKTVRDKLGLEKLELKFTPLTTIEQRLRAVENGDVDIECGSTTMTLTRRERVDFTLMTFITGSAVLSRKSDPIETIDDLEGAKVAVLEGTTTEAVMRRVIEVNGFPVELVLIDSHDEGMKLLNERKVLGYASDRAMLIGQVFRNENAANRYVMTRSPLSFEPYALMLKRGDTDFRLMADRALASLYRDARIRRLYHNWFGRYGEGMSPIVEAMYQFQAVGE